MGNGKIHPKSITICGDKIMFLATDGVYEFDGNNAKKIKIDFDNRFFSIDNNFAVGQFFDGVYYLACNFDFGDGEKYGCEKHNYLYNNALIKINTSTFDCEIVRGLDITAMLLIKDGVNNCLIATYAFNQTQTYIGILNSSGNIRGENIRKFWKSEFYDFDLPNKFKFVKEITLTTKTDITINVCLDNKVKKINVKGKDYPQKIKINAKAKKVSFEFIAETCGVYISMPQVKIGVYEK